MKFLYPIFLKHIEGSKLIQPGDTIIAAFSGGKDSLTLLLLLKELQKEIDFSLAAAYFNHRIRHDAQEEEQWVKDFCAAQRIQLKVGGADVPTYKSQHRLNLEHAASILRARFLAEAAAEYPNVKVATAHTKSDLAETFFIKLLRGSGSRGLSAIFERIDQTVPVIRPLLIFSKKEIISFLERNKLQYYKDHSNEEDTFLRNRIRSRLIPEIEKIAPDLEEHIAKTVSLVQAEYEYFKELAQKIAAENLLLNSILPIESLKKQHLAVQRHILREYIRLLKGDLLNIDYEHIESILKSLQTCQGMALPGIELKFHKGFIYPKDLVIPAYRCQVTSTGSFRIEEVAKEIIIEKCAAYRKPKDNFEIIIPYSTARFPLTIRSPKREDKYVKINSALEQRVFEMIRAAGFPAELRSLCPVLQDADGKIIWAVGAPVAHAFKVKERDEGPFLNIQSR